MRREFILILLGIISISTLSSLMSDYVQIDVDKVLLDSVVGAVGAGNFTYWQLGHNGNLLIELTSLSGDADLYVSEDSKPTYELDMYNFSSATCGADSVSVPATFPRPIGIGIYGYWSHTVSQYCIQVYLDTASMGPSEQIYTLVQRPYYDNPDLNPHKDNYVPTRHKPEQEKPRFLKIISIIDMIFEMFVM